MLKYLLSIGQPSAGPKTFKPDRRISFTLGDRLKAELYVEGGEYLATTYYEGVVEDRAVIHVIDSCPRTVAESLVKAEYIANFLNGLDGFFAGVIVGDDVTVFRDHVGLIPIYVSCGQPAFVTNIPIEAVAWQPRLNPLQPGTLISLPIWRSTKIWGSNRINGSTDGLLECLTSVLKGLCPRGVGIFFSGGLDSLIIAKLCNDLGLNPRLLTIGVEGSRDFERSMKAAALLGLDVVKVVVSGQRVSEALKRLEPLLGRMSVMDSAIAAAMNILSAEAVEVGCTATVSGQGADELFGGYKKYEKALLAEGYVAVEKMMHADLSRLHEYGLPRDFIAVRLSGTYMITPYLARKVVEVATTIALNQKLSVENGRVVRKKVLRELCKLLGLEELAGVEKKALQYGTGLERLVRRMGHGL